MSKKNAIDQEMIRELAELLKETELSEIEVEQDDLRIRIARHAAPRAVEVAAPAVAAPAPAQPAAAPAAAAQDDENHPGAVTSPMVGTAYHCPAPGSDPFVKVGDSVKAGQTVMIVEAMKTMNQIAATKAGTVSRILVEDSQPVEYGEPLLIIE
ncbi:acetyl-CoA carboxylase biotin carboxyl carrier protein [Salaquimonas pukyongi]|uniref:acetyl-CoA carboxylase biotin carboxyl carrier protein n=1 Tax=Salaquimonas pukyongi TaxID=2712698 RepID=UPI00096BB7CF|nr:acetyl-CoA carboxylase biotin carboxyl carrier protein [Salaquimonas pukyongi]